MSPRTLLAIASTTVLVVACARANSPEFDEDTQSNDDSSSSSGDSSSSSSSSGDSSSSSTGTGQGGGSTSSTGGSGGEQTTGTGTGTGGAGGGTTTGAGGMTNNCLHDTCTYGDPLTIGCGDPCVDTVCAADDYCCDQLGGEWDDICIDEAVDLCAIQCTAGPLPGDLVITEIMNNPAAVFDSAGEWFEVHNVTGSGIDLQGLVIRHQGITIDPNATVTITSSVIVPAGGYAVLGINGLFATNGGVNVDYVYTNVNLANGVDYLALEDGSGGTLDEVLYNEASGLDPDGKSRNLDPMYLSDTDNDDDAHFCEASSMMGGGDSGTPGQANDQCP